MPSSPAGYRRPGGERRQQQENQRHHRASHECSFPVERRAVLTRPSRTIPGPHGTTMIAASSVTAPVRDKALPFSCAPEFSVID
jgi:hypothetical protein